MSETPRFKRSTLPWILEAIVALIAGCLYRVRSSSTEGLPTGGALIAANHLSYVDVIALQLACPRPLRFVGYQGMRDSNWFFRLAFKLSGAIAISNRNPLGATRAVVRHLQAGDYVLVFVEGAISRTGQLMKIRRGYELMARQAGVPVVPVAHDGLWGSVFSFSGNRYLFKSPRLMRTHVYVAWGDPVPAAEMPPERLRRELLDLGKLAFDERPQLKRHLGREVVRGLARRPWRVELIDRTAARREVKAGQLLAAAAALSRHIRRTIPEKRVGIVLPPGAGASIANLAVLCAGKVPVNLNFTAGRASIEASLRLGEVSTIISAHAVREKVKEFPWPDRTLDLSTEIQTLGGKKAILPWLLGAWFLPNQWFANLLGLPKRGDTDEAGLLFTSGSSGEPKGVVLSHRNILANCWQISSLCILPDTATMLACLPVFHSFGFTVTLWYPMMRGCHVVTVPSPLDTRRIIEAIREESATVLIGAPTFLRPLVKRAEPADLRSLDLVVSGAEKMPLDLFTTVKEKFHIEIMQGYGLTETTPAANINQPHPLLPATPGAEPQVGKRLGAVGRMMPGMTARILHPDTMTELPFTEQGLVVFRGGNVFAGYLKNPEKTAEAFHGDWFVTGDLGRFDEDGFLYIEGRLSRFSKIGGEMVPHGTIEQRIIDVFDLDQSEGYVIAVVGVPDANKGEALVLLTTMELASDELRDRLMAAGLPALWVPRTVSQIDAIPVLGTGKLDLKGCKELATAVAANKS
ncbi:AMP-binding protein [Synoicihabitans lomoniglobus]|uniref:AMP-binding protein n=1 Tax=Synoicihabitans lomoniglobus TaxID=2909285 RepID=A0AAF0CRE3_9BACT|nr:AMP-binding protein [Opitutaceae bacterium LMO-M01]WED66684.1 AMP-binding protein [Opitutaceae bacterium LMO-M01]